MRRTIIVLCALLLLMPMVWAEPVSLEEINAYAKLQYKSQWKNAALSIRSVLPQDEQGGYTYSTTIAFPNRKAAEVCRLMAERLSAAVELDTIEADDTTPYLFRARTYVYSAASQVGGFYRFHLCLHPLITVQALDDEARLTVSLQYYEIVKTDKGIVSSIFNRGEGRPLPAEQWLLSDRFPYNERGKMPLATAEAFTKSYALIQLLIRRISAQ